MYNTNKFKNKKVVEPKRQLQLFFELHFDL